MREILNAYKFLIEKPEGKKSVGRTRRRSEDNPKMNHKGLNSRLFVAVVYLR
jgi:hypothetical protein